MISPKSIDNDEDDIFRHGLGFPTSARNKTKNSENPNQRKENTQFITIMMRVHQLLQVMPPYTKDLNQILKKF